MALNAIPYDYYHRQWWFESLGLETTTYAIRDSLTQFNIGATLAMTGLTAIERLSLIGNQKPSHEVRGAAGTP